MAKGILDLLKQRLKGQKTLIVSGDDIAVILPHRGRMLLLDQVTITKGKNPKVLGKLLVTEEICEGHAVLGGHLVFRGVDIAEMAAQTLGVYWGINHPEFVERKCMLRSFGNAKFSKPVFVGDSLVIEVSTNNISSRSLGGPEIKKTIIRIKGRMFIARVDRERKAQINNIELALLP